MENLKFNSTLFSTPKRGVGGKATYRGNCCPQIIEAFINQYNMKYLSDYAIGSGTTKDVCERLGIKGVWTDLRLGFDLMNNDIPDYPENIFYHPAYWNMNNKIIYSNTEYSWQEVKNKYGYDPRETDLSQAPTWERFIQMLNYTVLKQYAALEKGGHMGILMGDIKSKGKLYSMLFEIAKPGTVEQVIIKEQHNCASDHTTYSGKFIPTVHEYLLIIRKDSPYALDFQMVRNVKLDIRDSECATWKDLVFAVIQHFKGNFTLGQIYNEIENHKKAQTNKHYKEKVRQILQELQRDGLASNISKGVWAKAA